MSESPSAMEAFIQALQPTLPKEQVVDDYALRYALATDASFYRLIPHYVVMVKNAHQVQHIIKQANRYAIPLTFRAAGTSLSGQAISDSVLVVLSDDWQDIDIAPSGEWVKVCPSMIGAKVNALLAPFGRKIGPDPASINTCKIGGIAANNASGMCCGVKNNSYHTLKDMTLIFADGTRLDTSSVASIEQFKQSHETFIEALETLAQEVKENTDLAHRISHKYRLKNTTGYGLNALVDYNDGIDIIKHLLIGSEGTLGFIADITYNTVVDPRFKQTGLYTFADVESACALIQQLSTLEIEAVEMLDKRALMSVRDHSVMPQNVNEFPDDAAALLIEIAGGSQAQLDAINSTVTELLDTYADHLVHHYPLSDDKVRAQALWNVRKGTFPAVGAVRKTGTTVIIEDVAFALEDLSTGIHRLHQLFDKHGYDEAIIFGHALAGNLHFVFTQGFDSEEEITRYERFMADVAQLVAVDLNGSLKAEHGTGRNMAPYVELEWGSDGYQVMQRIKALFDEKGILNPGVILNPDEKAHVKNLKAMPASDAQIDPCIECGFCEPVCPSKEYTLTPRQRISLKRHEQQIREQLRLQQDASQTQRLRQKLGAVQQRYQHLAIDSCAATGLCATRCPVGINTGEYIKSLRAQKSQSSRVIRAVGKIAASHFSTTSTFARVGIRSAHVVANTLGQQRMQNMSRWLHKNFGAPLYYSAWPHAQQQQITVTDKSTSPRKVVYVPSCANRIFANDDKRSVQSVFASLCQKAGISIVSPTKLEELCCGMPWKSKGLNEQAKDKQTQLHQTIASLSEDGKWPVVMDASPCAMTSQLGDKIEVIDSMTFATEHLLPRLDVEQRNDTVWVHITCSSQHMDGGKTMLQLANALSKDVQTTSVSCCGFAGDKGFTQPQLNAHALRGLKANKPSTCEQGYSNSRTCEIGLKEHSGVPFKSLLHLLDEQSQGAER
ncbi:FAD-binding and (Fe-S)-binding domain-containing protein [Pseudoalteromonas sp. GB56]